MLKDEVALVTGGSSGIGLAIARELIKERARVIITGRDEVRLEAAASSLREAASCTHGPTFKTDGDRVLAVRCDQGRLDEIVRLMDLIGERYGRIDALIANAGYARPTPIDETDEELFDELVGVNLKGTYFTVKHAVPLLTENARVVIITSISNQRWVPGTTVFAAAKAGLRSMARSLSGELISRGVRVNALSPGFVDTAIYHDGRLSTEVLELCDGFVRSSVPMRRWGSSEEIARAAIFLCSDASSFMTGTELVSDGGLSQL